MKNMTDKQLEKSHDIVFSRVMGQYEPRSPEELALNIADRELWAEHVEEMKLRKMWSEDE